MAEQIPLSKLLKAIDLKQRDFYDKLSDDEKKSFNTFTLNRFISNCEDGPDLAEWWLVATNTRVNKHFFALSNHPKLQWLVLTTASPGMGTTYHKWIPHKKKNTSHKVDKKVFETLKMLYPAMKSSDVELMAQINTKATVKAYLKELGYDDKQIKEML